MEKIKKIAIDNIPIILILFVGFIIINWFRGNFIIDTLDFTFPYDRDFFLNRLFYIWNNSNSLGFLDSRIFANLIPYGIYTFILNFFDVPLVFGQKILVYIVFSGSGLSMYYLSRVIGLNKTAATVGAFFYMMNPFSMTFIWPIRNLFILSYAFMPLAVGHYISIFRSDKLSLKNSILHVFLIFFLLTSAFSNPIIMLIYFFPVFLYTVISFVGKKRNYGVIKFGIISLILFLFLSSFWLVPFLGSFKTELGNAESKISDDLTVLKTNSKKALGAFSFTGFWALESSYKGDSYYPWFYKFETSQGIFLKFIPFLLFIIYLIYEKNKKRKIFLSIIVTSCIFFITGIDDIFPSAKIRILEKFSFLVVAFRGLETKFSPILLLAISPAIGLGFSMLIKNFKGNSSKIIKIFLVIPIFMYFIYFVYLMEPFFSGNVIYGGGENYPSSRVKVPEYYQEARKWLSDQDKNFKIISFPISNVYLSAYKWPSGFSGTNPDRYLLGRNIITNNTGKSHEVLSEIGSISLINDNAYEKILELAGMINVKYLLFHYDADWNFIKDNKFWFEIYPKTFDAIKKRSIYHEFGELTFIEIPEYYLNPYIFTLGEVNFFGDKNKKGIDIYLRNFSEDPFVHKEENKKNYFVVKKENNEIDYNKNELKKPKEANFESINSTKKIIHIVEAKAPFFLVMSESYDSRWQVHLNNKKTDNFFGKFWPYPITNKVQDSHHYELNGYLNSWYINPDELCKNDNTACQKNADGSYNLEMTIEFWPQRLFYLGLIISGTTFIGCLGYLLYAWRKRRKLRLKENETVVDNRL